MFWVLIIQKKLKYNYKHIIVGSSYFFNKLPAFKPKDLDVVVFKTNTSFDYYHQIGFDGKDIFTWNKKSVFKFDYSENPMAIGKFLVPEILDELGVDFEFVKLILQNNIDKLAKRHEYQKLIFDFYIENNEMKLTEEQLNIVYNNYLKNKK